MATAIWGAAAVDPRAHEYADYHARRMVFAVNACRTACPDSKARVLDIGRNALTESLREHYSRVTTLGFACGAFDHIPFDLNDAAKGPPTDERFDLIVFAEVIEHLYTAPEIVLGMLGQMVRPGGHIVLQTPNAADLLKRIKLLLGRNPYERIRTDTFNPGHFREYTKRELIGIAEQAGFTVISHRYAEYFGAYGGGTKRYVLLPLLRAVAAVFPSLARGQTIVLRRSHQPARLSTL